MPGTVSNTYHGYKEDMPRPDVQTLLTQNPPSLDHKNRFFEDNKKRLNKMLVYDYAQDEPQYSDKKELASKVTVREFIKMPDVEAPMPKGYREGVVRTQKRPTTTPLKKQRIVKGDVYATANKRRNTKQVSEVDMQDSAKAVGVSDDQPMASQIEEKM